MKQGLGQGLKHDLSVLRGLFFSIVVIAAITSIDQIFKVLIIELLKSKYGMNIKVTEFFSLVYTWNYGISFGLFSNFYQYSNYIFLAINCLLTGYLFSLLIRTKSKFMHSGLVLIIGGAIGNIIDRIFRGAVFDFLYFHYNQYSFPAFNLADSFINIGVFFVLISFIRSR
ncbi:MAG: signal peptidase II [Rickettsiaceae bacterium]|nr:signal peptidase II [Rickettsiaceae bacterium]